METKNLLELPLEMLLEIAKKLKPSDLPAVHRASSALNATFDQAPFWQDAVRNHELLNSYTVDDPEFRHYKFDLSEVMKMLSRHRTVSKKVFKNTPVEPWELAALMGKVDEITQIHGVDTPLLMNEGRFSVIHYLVMGAHKEKAIAFLDLHYATLKANSSLVHELLICAVWSGDFEMLEILRQRFNYDLRKVYRKRTLLHAAVEADKDQMLQWLLDQGIDSRVGKDLAVLAAKKNLWDIFLDLYKRKLLSRTIEDVINLVHYLIRATAIEVAFSFIQIFGLDPKQGKERDEHCFYAAVTSNDLTTLENAVRAGWGKWNDKFYFGQNILHVAANHGCTKLFAEMCKEYSNEVSKDAPDVDGNTVLHYAAQLDDVKKFEEILAIVGLDMLYKTNKDGLTPAHVAARFGSTNLLYVLHKKQGDKILQSVDNNGNTVLHCSVEFGHALLSKWLVNVRGFSLKTQNTQQKTPFRLLADKAPANNRNWLKLEAIFYAINPDISLLSACNDGDDRCIFDLIEQDMMHHIVDRIKKSAEKINAPKILTQPN